MRGSATWLCTAVMRPVVRSRRKAHQLQAAAYIQQLRLITPSLTVHHNSLPAPVITPDPSVALGLHHRLLQGSTVALTCVPVAAHRLPPGQLRTAWVHIQLARAHFERMEYTRAVAAFQTARQVCGCVPLVMQARQCTVLVGRHNRAWHYTQQLHYLSLRTQRMFCRGYAPPIHKHLECTCHVLALGSHMSHTRWLGALSSPVCCWLPTQHGTHSWTGTEWRAWSCSALCCGT
jgi:hypothetical protein